MAQNPNFALYFRLNEYQDIRIREMREERQNEIHTRTFDENLINNPTKQIIKTEENNADTNYLQNRKNMMDQLSSVSYFQNNPSIRSERNKNGTFSPSQIPEKFANSSYKLDRSIKNERVEFVGDDAPKSTSEYILDDINKPTFKVKTFPIGTSSYKNENAEMSEILDNVPPGKTAVLEPHQRQSMPSRLDHNGDQSRYSYQAENNLVDRSILGLLVDEKSFAENRPDFKENYEKFAAKSGEFFRRYHLQRLVLIQRSSIKSVQDDFRLKPDEKRSKLSEIFVKIVNQFGVETSEVSKVRPITEEDVRREMIRLDLTGWIPTSFFKLLDDYFEG